MSHTFPKHAPGQTQPVQPGIESEMNPLPIYEAADDEKKDGKLKDKVAIITGGDSGIGRAVSLAYAKEGAKVAIVHHPREVDDAAVVKNKIEQIGGQCLLIEADLTQSTVATEIVSKTKEAFGQVNILVNNAAVQYPQKNIADITDKDLHDTFAVNYFATFYLTRAVVPHLTTGDCVINTTSVTAYEGNEQLLDYSSTKGALRAFTQSLAMNLAKKGIRVNAVAPGPIWTPLIPASFDEKKVAEHGTKVPLGRMGQPVELAGSYVLLASAEGSYMSGTTIHVNGGTITDS
ncbi:MAG: SDR family oxidoreductase [Defluviitaleaceae bacterium]|nr:SDR family oxidoreductase [Defluviitaleaceae bacterium]